MLTLRLSAITLPALQIFFYIHSSAIFITLPMQEEVDINPQFQQVTRAYFDQRYQDQQFINRGSGSKIYSAFDSQEHRKVAIKEYNKLQLQSAPQDVIREISMLGFSMNMGMEVALSYYGAFRVFDEQKKTSKYCLILELCSQSLAQFIKSEQFEKITVVQKLQLFWRIAKQVSILHMFNIIHRDLKPGNILFAKRGQLETPVIADFGHSKQILDNVNTIMKGTIIYANPNQIENTNYGLEWDIYSLGVILAELFKGDLLFKLSPKYNTEKKLIEKLREEMENIDIILSQIDFLSIDIKELVKRCLKDQSFTAEQVVNQVNKIIEIEKTKERSNPKTVIRQDSFQISSQPPANPNEQTNSFPQSISKYSTVESNKTIQAQLQIITSSSNQVDDLATKKLKSERSESLQPKANSLKQAKGEKVSSDISQFNKATQNEESPHFVRKSFTFNDLSLLNQKEEDHTLKSVKVFKAVSSKESLNNLEFSCQTQNVAKALAWKINIQKRTVQCASAEKELVKFKKYESMFKNLRKIEDCPLNEKTKKKLLILGLKNIIVQLMAFHKENSNAFTAKFATQLLEKIKSIEGPITRNFLQSHQKELNPSAEKVFTSHSPPVGDLKQEFKNNLQNLSNPLLYTQLEHVLD